MSLREFDNYPNLPGMMTDFKDGGLKVRSEFPIPDTDSVLLLAKCCRRARHGTCRC